jgi:hypothetical protein
MAQWIRKASGEELFAPIVKAWLAAPVLQNAERTARGELYAEAMAEEKMKQDAKKQGRENNVQGKL